MIYEYLSILKSRVSMSWFSWASSPLDLLAQLNYYVGLVSLSEGFHFGKLNNMDTLSKSGSNMRCISNLTLPHVRRAFWDT